MEHVDACKAKASEVGHVVMTKATELGHVVKAKAEDFKDAAGPLGHSLKETAGHWGHGIKQTAGHVGHGLKEAACQLGHGTQETTGKLDRGLKGAAGHVAHSAKETAGHWGHGIKVAGSHLRDKTAEMTRGAESACKTTFDSETQLHKWLEGVKPGYGRYAEKLWASDITCLKELSVLSAEHLAQMGVGNPAHAAVIKERAKTDLDGRTFAAGVLALTAVSATLVGALLACKLGILATRGTCGATAATAKGVARPFTRGRKAQAPPPAELPSWQRLPLHLRDLILEKLPW